MNEAPKKIWYNFEYHKMIISGMDNDDVPYIRADLVEELIKALEKIQLYGHMTNDVWLSIIAIDALNAMEEENGN